MTPVKSLIKHDPDNGLHGDCHRACIASLLDLPADEVPHFFDYNDDSVKDTAERGIKHQDEWLAERGLAFLELPAVAECLQDVLNYVERYCAGVHYMLVAISKGGTNHCVICKDSEIVHDPTYGQPHGITGPAKDGYWWIGFIIKKL